MTLTAALLAPLLATVGGAAILGCVKWLRAVSTAVGKLAEVAETLSGITLDVAELRASFAEHLRDCRHALAAGRPPYPPYPGPDRRVPRPRPGAETSA